ncbi:type IV secretion system DNA-binding domain-containing protein [Acinetobacter baumannii]|uniref:type IV secretion system DNA-binding domain-containing protein n=1 Tax=Acinetobacter baumannii TaxID=470 RepID=UPI0011227130|nr:type IV secretion system DNA-binding domain-containing protein [Acinetobacter baumannii]
MNDQSQKIFGQAVMSVVLITLFTWLIFLPKFFIFPKEHKAQALLYAIPLTFKTPLYVLILLTVLLVSSAFAWFYFQNNKTPFGGERYVRVLRGLQLVSSFKLKRMVKESGHQVRFCSLPVPHDLKFKHFLLTGGTGQGKSVSISDFLSSCVEDKRNKTRLIVIDPNGTYASLFYKKGDVIFNPFDARTKNWSILNEIRNSYDIETYAMTVIPRSSDAQHENFLAYARQIVVAAMQKILEMDDLNRAEKSKYFENILLVSSDDDLKAFLAGTNAYSALGNEELVGTLRSIVTTYLTPHTHCQKGNFSFRDFLKHGDGNIFITWREDQLTALQPLVSCATDVICSSLLSDFDNYADFIFCLDELGSLNRLSYLEAVLTKGRKHRLVALAGIQSLAQLNRIYGREDAMTLRGCFSSFGVCALNSQDTYTPQEYEKAFGSVEVLRRMKSANKDAKVELVKDKEHVVKAEEISNLRPLHFYLKFSGHYPPTLIKMKYRSYDKVTDSFLAV